MEIGLGNLTANSADFNSRVLDGAKPDQLYHAQVLDTTSDGKAALRIGDKTIIVQTDAPLQPNSKIDLMVKGFDRDNVQLAVVGRQESSSVRELTRQDIPSRLIAFDIPDTEQNVRIAQEMTRQGVPVMKDAILELSEALRGSRDPKDLEFLVAAMKKDVPAESGQLPLRDRMEKAWPGIPERLASGIDQLKILSDHIAKQIPDESRRAEFLQKVEALILKPDAPPAEQTARISESVRPFLQSVEHDLSALSLLRPPAADGIDRALNLLFQDLAAILDAALESGRPESASSGGLVAKAIRFANSSFMTAPQPASGTAPMTPMRPDGETAAASSAKPATLNLETAGLRELFKAAIAETPQNQFAARVARLVADALSGSLETAASKAGPQNDAVVKGAPQLGTASALSAADAPEKQGPPAQTVSASLREAVKFAVATQTPEPFFINLDDEAAAPHPAPQLDFPSRLAAADAIAKGLENILLNSEKIIELAGKIVQTPQWDPAAVRALLDAAAEGARENLFLLSRLPVGEADFPAIQTALDAVAKEVRKLLEIGIEAAAAKNPQTQDVAARSGELRQAAQALRDALEGAPVQNEIRSLQQSVRAASDLRVFLAQALNGPNLSPEARAFVQNFTQNLHLVNVANAVQHSGSEPMGQLLAFIPLQFEDRTELAQLRVFTPQDRDGKGKRKKLDAENASLALILTTPNLGKNWIRLVTKNNRLHCSIETQSEATRDLFRANLADLRKGLEELPFAFGGIEVEQRKESPPETFAPPAESPFGPSVIDIQA